MADPERRTLSRVLTDDDSRPEPLLVLPAHRVAGEVRDRVVWTAAPGRVPTEALVGAVLAAARRSVDVAVPAPVSSWSRDPGAALLRQALDGDREDHGPDSAVLDELVRRLRREDLEVVVGVGHGPHRIHLGVVAQEPVSAPSGELPFGVAIDADLEPPVVGRLPGRDEIRLRHEQLTRMGWVPLRVRSTDVFTDPAREVARVHQALRDHAARRS